MSNSMEASSFASKFISRIQRIDAPQIESFLTQILKEKDFQKFVLDSLQDGVLVADSEGRIVFANEAVHGLLGTGGGRRLIGQALQRLLKAKALLAILEEFETDRIAIDQREVRVRTPATRIYAVSVVPVEGQRGMLTHSVWILSDQTEAHRRAAERHQFESLRSLATLIAGIAHEIKNPLNSMTIHAQLVAKAAREYTHTCEETPELERLSRSTGVLLEEIDRLTHIVDQFIKAARPPKIEARATKINDVVTAVAELIHPECEERHIDLELDLDPGLPRVQIDPAQIQQAILNIAKNSMEAIDKPRGRLAFRTALRTDHLLIEIEDNGCGIPEENRLKIFEPYHTTKFDGSGLGLMVVFRIVSAHGGQIGLDSEVGVGTSFKIALPLDERPVRLLEASTQAGDRKPSQYGRSGPERADKAP